MEFLTRKRKDVYSHMRKEREQRTGGEHMKASSKINPRNYYLTFVVDENRLTVDWTHHK